VGAEEHVFKDNMQRPTYQTGDGFTLKMGNGYVLSPANKSSNHKKVVADSIYTTSKSKQDTTESKCKSETFQNAIGEDQSKENSHSASPVQEYGIKSKSSTSSKGREASKDESKSMSNDRVDVDDETPESEKVSDEAYSSNEFEKRDESNNYTDVDQSDGGKADADRDAAQSKNVEDEASM